METASNKIVTNQEINEDELAATLNEKKAFFYHSTIVVDLDPFIIAKCKLIEEQLVDQKSSIDRIAACIIACKRSKEHLTILQLILQLKKTPIKIEIMEKVNMDSLVTVLANIEKLGFRSQFEVTGNNLVSLKTNTHFLPEEVTIKHFYRFEGESNPDDSSILYAIESITGEKGTLVDGYGTSADADTANFMLHVSTSKAKNI